MKTSRKLQLWLADRHPAFDKPGLYRRPAQVAEVTAKGWDAVLIAMVAMILLAIGFFGLMFAVFLISVMFSTWFG